jgi:hypothetical protein
MATRVRNAESKARRREELSPDEQADKYVRDTCRELETVYDRKAVELILTSGVLGEDGGAIEDAVVELAGVDTDEFSHKVIAAQEANSFNDLEELEMERWTASVEAAYLLGIAVGRRLGSGALRVSGGAR